MSKFQRGQIWLVNFDPSFGHEYTKVRPAVIVQSDRYIESNNVLTVIPISSQTIKQTDLDILLEKNAQNRLMTDSLLKTKQVSSFDKRRFIKLIGIANKETMIKIGENVQLFLI